MNDNYQDGIYSTTISSDSLDNTNSLSYSTSTSSNNNKVIQKRSVRTVSWTHSILKRTMIIECVGFVKKIIR